jgi:hypothetical protein
MYASDMGYCTNCRRRVRVAVSFCPECRQLLLRVAHHHRRYSQPSAKPARPTRKPCSSTGRRELERVVVAAAVGWLGRRKNIGQALVVLALGLLLMLVVVFSAMRSGDDEYTGEMRTKSLVYDTDSDGKLGLYWMDDQANSRKATPEEIKRCDKLHPDEAIPVCQTTYYEKADNKQ